MKKIYLLAIGLSTGMLSFGQNLQQTKVLLNENSPIQKSIKLSNDNKALGSIIYSNDFDNPGDWTIDNDGQTAPGFGWTVDSINDGWWPQGTPRAITSTSGGNYAELTNGDQTLTTPDHKFNVLYTVTTTNPINLIAAGGTGAENSVLEFEQWGARFFDEQAILISTDGTNFTKVGDNNDIELVSGNGGSHYDNPTIKRIDLSNFLDGTTAQQVWIRFSWTSLFPTSTVSNSWITYGWYIDDVKIRTKPDNDLQVDASNWGSNFIYYSRIPTTQVAPIDFYANVSNVGTKNATGVVLTADITGAATASVSSTPKNIAANDKDSLWTATYTPPAVPGAYNFEISLSSDSVDDFEGNNIGLSSSFEVVPSTSIYARDLGGTTALGIVDGGGYSNKIPVAEDFEAGNEFIIYNEQKVGGIQVVIGNGTEEGAIMDVVLYAKLPNNRFILIDRSAAYVVQAADKLTPVTLPLPTQPVLEANTTYFAAVHGWGSSGGSVPEFFYGTSGDSPSPTNGPIGVTSRKYHPNMANPDDGYAFYVERTPMVRLSFDLSITDPNGIENIENNSISYNVYPNPSNDIFNINLDSDISDNLNLTVTNIVGETIINRSIAVSGKSNETISLSDYSKGIYFLTIGKVTKKLIVN